MDLKKIECNNKHVYFMCVIGGLIPRSHSLMLSGSLPVYQVRLDWLPLTCIALIQPNH